jgi:hypothetical protein
MLINREGRSDLSEVSEARSTPITPHNLQNVSRGFCMTCNVPISVGD